MKRISLYTYLLMFLMMVASGSIFAQPAIELATDTTSPELVDISIRSTTDPAGHSCCVTPPPLQINLFLNAGTVNFDPDPTIGAPAWFDFGPMTLDPNLGFSGQSRSTVAGFGQILSILTGTITAEDNIEAEIVIGADGGLPTGQPITFGVDIKPQFLFAFVNAPSTESTLSLDLESMDEGEISISDETLDPQSGLDLFLSMNIGSDDSEADWWIAMQDNTAEPGANLFYFDLATGSFSPGLQASYQGPLINIPEPVKLLEGFVPPSEDFVIVFGVDKSSNGELDLDLLRAVGARYRNGL